MLTSIEDPPRSATGPLRTVSRAVLHATPKRVLVGSHAATLGLFAFATRGNDDPAALLTIVALGLSMSCGAVYTDPSASATAHAVVSLRRRTAIRSALSCAFVVTSVSVASWIARQAIEESVSFATWWLHGAALCSLSASVCARAARRSPGTHNEARGAAAVFLVFAMTKALSFRFPSWPDLGRAQAPIFWYLVLGGSLISLWHETRDYVHK